MLGDFKDTEFGDESSNRAFMFGKYIVWILLLFFITMLIWAHFSVIDEITKAQGQVISSSKNQLIQSLEGGIVEKILVEEGERVSKGQALVKMDDVHFSSLLREGEVKEFAHEIKIIRIESELEGKRFVVPKDIAEKYPDLIAGENELYTSRQAELRSLFGVQNLLKKEIGMVTPLLETGAVSEVELLRLRQRLREIDINISKFRSGLLQELNMARLERDRAHANNSSLRDRLTRTELRSPVKGIVKQIYVSTIGGVVNPGVPILEVVPIEDKLLIEARVMPQDIGFLHEGHQCDVKISAYDFSVYGSLPGKVSHISADTSVDARGASFYEVWVRTDKNYLDYKGRKLQIMPGMQVQVDIKTGQKTVLSYLLKPILKTAGQSFTER